MNIKNFENKFKDFSGRIFFNYSLKKLNWFNIGGNAKEAVLAMGRSAISHLVKFFDHYNKHRIIE